MNHWRATYSTDPHTTARKLNKFVRRRQILEELTKAKYILEELTKAKLVFVYFEIIATLTLI